MSTLERLTYILDLGELCLLRLLELDRLPLELSRSKLEVHGHIE